MIKKASVVRSLCGRDKGKMFIVISVDGNFAYIADGSSRRIEKPKKKKLKHLEFTLTSTGKAAEKLFVGEKATNSELRKAISAVADILKGGVLLV